MWNPASTLALAPQLGLPTPSLALPTPPAPAPAPVPAPATPRRPLMPPPSLSKCPNTTTTSTSNAPFTTLRVFSRRSRKQEEDNESKLRRTDEDCIKIGPSPFAQTIPLDLIEALLRNTLVSLAVGVDRSRGSVPTFPFLENG